MNSSKKIKSKLAQYGSLAAAITGLSDAHAAIVYTDITPDFAGGIGNQYFVDLNNDGTDDFRIYHSSSNLYIQPLNSSNGVLGTGGNTFAYPFALNSGVTIDSSGTFFNNGYSSGFQSMNYGSCSFGNWCNVNDRFLGVSFIIGSDIHYGWIRLDVNANGNSWTVKDYAYENIAGGSIMAGMVPSFVSADPASNIMASDIADNSNGMDLQVDFTAAVDETTLSEYRIIAVKSGNAPSFNINLAGALPATNYTVITPNGSATYSQILGANFIDTDGDTITTGQAYKVFIYSVENGTISTAGSLASSPDITLLTEVDPVTNLVGSDILDNGNALDIQVNFDGIMDETTISEYRIYIVPTANAGSFNFAVADGLPLGLYFPVATNGSSNYSVTLSTATISTDFNQITTGIPYTVFVMSKEQVLPGYSGVLSSPSASFQLTNFADVATGVTGTDIANNMNGLDVLVDFNAGDESTLTDYKIIIVKDTIASSFNLATAQTVANANITTVTPTGASSYSQILSATSTDSDGDAIINGVQYRAFILSTLNSTFSTSDNLSVGSNTFILDQSIGVEENELDNVSAFAQYGSLNLNVPATIINSGINLEIYALDGKLLDSHNLVETNTVIDVNSYSTGIYLLKLINKTGSARTIKIQL